MKNKLTFTVLALMALGSLHAADIYVCTSAGSSPEIQQAAADFASRAETTPLLKALHTAGGSGGVVAQPSEELLATSAYDRAAHNHLIVIGRPSQDPLMKRVLGHVVGIDEDKKQLQSLGWGKFQGDIGWVESDRNPFLHSRQIKSAPEGTLLVKITGTSDEGVKAALKAFENGLLNGVVPAGEFTRPETTLLDLDPLLTGAPIELPREVPVKGGTGYLAGWSQVPESEYRAVLEATGREPLRMWRYKYLAPGFLEKPSMERWLSGPHRQAFGNAFEVVEFDDETNASQAMVKMARENFKPIELEGIEKAKVAPQMTDQVVEKPLWDVIVAAVGRFVVLSTLPAESTAKLAQPLAGAAAPAEGAR